MPKSFPAPKLSPDLDERDIILKAVKDLLNLASLEMLVEILTMLTRNCRSRPDTDYENPGQASE